MRDAVWIVAGSIGAIVAVVLIGRLVWFLFMGDPIEGIGD
jgi:hypothetical protein